MFTLLLVGLSFLCFAQDVIVKRDGSEIKSIVVEITDLTLKYRLYQDSEGLIYDINKSEVFMVIYQNGTRETFSKQLEQTKVSSDLKSNYFMLGAGVGNSYGGLGLRAQYRTGKNIGFAFHAGIGYFPYTSDGDIFGGTVGFSTGAKLYFYKSFYINSQVGITTIEQKYSYIWHNDYYGGYGSDFGMEHNTIWGVSTLVGGDWVWGKKVGFGFNAAVGPAFNFNFEDYPVTLAMDLGFIIRF